MIDLTVDLKDYLLERVQDFISVATDPDCDPGDRDFWMDPNTVVYINSPGEDEVMAATFEDLSEELGYFDEFLTRDIITTYLSTGDLALIICSEEEQTRNAQVAVADRSTGVVMVKPGNLFDTERLSQIGGLAKENTLHSDDLKPAVSSYFLVSSRESEVGSKELALSKNRLKSILGEIEINAVCRYTGLELKLKDQD